MLGKRPAAHDRRSISRRVITHLLLCTIVLMGLVFTSASAEAQWHKRRQALALAGEAIDLYKAGDYQPALEKFTKANELLPAPTLKIRIARCLDRLDRLEEATKVYRELIGAELKRWAPRKHKQARKDAVTELSNLLQQVPSVVIEVQGDPAGEAEVQVNGRFVPTRERKMSLDPGLHVFTASLGQRKVERQVNVERGSSMTVRLKLPPEISAADLNANDGMSAMEIGGWAAIGVGGAATLMGAVTGSLMLSRKSDLDTRCPNGLCPAEAHEDARSYNTLRPLTTVGLAVGAAGLGTGVTLLMLSSDNTDEPAPEPAAVEARQRKQRNRASLKLHAAPGGMLLLGRF